MAEMEGSHNNRILLSFVFALYVPHNEKKKNVRINLNDLLPSLLARKFHVRVACVFFFYSLHSLLLLFFFFFGGGKRDSDD